MGIRVVNVTKDFRVCIKLTSFCTRVFRLLQKLPSRERWEYLTMQSTRTRMLKNSGKSSCQVLIYGGTCTRAISRDHRNNFTLDEQTYGKY